ncbi:hypothetical protein ABB29_14725 [Pseudoxanthomonas dokdonensis]|uniref:Type I restriction modification DNA specificity domain-containing protein n=1 Tax=Pseudoxanthomonas dokdonensis TaxID=344882 RepID=A0A0R0CR87_9GAMM|nr:hypothetical protein ABB29_14725 [Pseudoxanthomonas dokdonensis]
MAWLEPLFDVAFDAPDGIARLRQLVLTLAMQGKLVPQDPKDTSISELLNQITEEKSERGKAGRIRSPRILVPVSEAEKLHEIPTNWKWVRLGEFAEYNGRENIEPEKIKKNAWVLDLEDIEKETSKLLYRATYSERESKSTKSTFKAGDVLYGKLRPYLDKVIVADSDGVCTTEIVPIVPSKAVIPEFLRWLLKRPAFLAHVNNLMYGVKMPRLGTDDAINSAHPLPPLEEQKRIVARIEELMSHCDELDRLRQRQAEKRAATRAATVRQWLAGDDAAAALLRKNFSTLVSTREDVAELRKAILQLAVMGKLVLQDPTETPASVFLKQVEAEKARREKEEGLRTSAEPSVGADEQYCGTPDGWSYGRLGNLAKFIDYRGRTPKKVGAGIPLITAKNVRFGYISREPREYVSNSEYNEWMTRGFPRVGDMLFTTEAPLGNVAIIDIPEKFALAQRVICFQFHAPAMAEFLKIVMMSEILQSRLLTDATGMTATGIKASKLKEIPVPIPPLNEQKRIVARVDALMRLCDMLEQSIDVAQAKQAELLCAVMARV